MPKKLVLFFAIVYSIALLLMSLVKQTYVPDVGLSFGDKIFHFLAYFVLTFLWFVAFLDLFDLKKRKALVYASMFSVIFGIIIEILQSVLTTYRTLDLYDVLANSGGVLFAAVIIVVKKNIDIKII